MRVLWIFVTEKILLVLMKNLIIELSIGGVALLSLE